MADKYDQMIDAALAPQGDKYDQMIDAALKDAPASPRMAADSGEALLTNLPAQGFKQNLVRGLPAAAGGMAGAVGGAAMGAPFGPVGIIAGGILGAGIGGGAGEATRQSVSQMTAGAFPEQAYPMATGREVLRDVGIQAATNAAAEAAGIGIGAAYKSLRPALSRGGASVMKVTANVPEKSGVYALDDLTRLGKAPTDEAVSKSYDAFHSASGTVGRKEAIARSNDPFDTVSRAVNSMKEAYAKLRAGTLTVQEAVEASQAGRIIRDMKSRGNEFAQEVAGTADSLKGSFDDFIENSFSGSSSVNRVPLETPPNPGIARAGHHAPKPRGTPILDPYGQPVFVDSVTTTPGKPGYPEWQAARQAAFENSVANDFGSFFPRNVNGTPNKLAVWTGATTGATAGATTGAVIAGPIGAAVGGGIGALGGALSVSPMAYGAAIRTAGAASRVAGAIPAPVYRVGAKALTGGAGSALADAYMRQPQAAR